MIVTARAQFQQRWRNWRMCNALGGQANLRLQKISFSRYVLLLKTQIILPDTARDGLSTNRGMLDRLDGNDGGGRGLNLDDGLGRFSSFGGHSSRRFAKWCFLECYAMLVEQRIVDQSRKTVQERMPKCWPSISLFGAPRSQKASSQIDGRAYLGRASSKYLKSGSSRKRGMES